MAHRPTFPCHKDLCHLSRDDAEAALAALRVLVAVGVAEVYTSAGSRDTRWQVWMTYRRERIPLHDWAAWWLELQHTPTGGDAA